MVLLGLSEILASLRCRRDGRRVENTRRWLPWVRSVVPNGVDLTRFRPGEPSTCPSVLFVGTYRRRKRGKLLADVFQRDVLHALPTAELWMVCEDAAPQPGVKVLGRVSDDDLAELYRRAWVFCLPSTYEGFGIPYVEAMASGVRSSRRRNPGAVEVTRNGTLGVIVDDDRLGEVLVAPVDLDRGAEASGPRRAARHCRLRPQDCRGGIRGHLRAAPDRPPRLRGGLSAMN